MTEKDLNKEIEVQPNQKILIIDCQPVTKQNRQVWFKLTEQELPESGEGDGWFEKASGLVLTSIEAEKSTKTPITEREKGAKLTLPESVNDFPAIIISGSPFAAYAREQDDKLLVASWKRDLIRFVRQAKDQKVPILGICFGAQILAEAFGGKVEKMKTKDGKDVWEAGFSIVKKAPGASNDPVLKDLTDEFVVPQNHKDVISKLPEGAVLLAENEYGVQGFKIDNCYGFEFHAERGAARTEKFIKENEESMRKYELDIEKIKEIGKNYSTEIRTIFSNFLKFAWSKAQ